MENDPLGVSPTFCQLGYTVDPTSDGDVFLNYTIACLWIDEKPIYYKSHYKSEDAMKCNIQCQ